MNDGIIKADGTSRLVRSVADFKTRYPTYDAFAEALAAGTLPVDILFSAAGWSQLPDFLNKASLLTDPTAAFFGLGPEAVPNDVLAFLGRYNQHWWRRRVLDGYYSVLMGAESEVYFGRADAAHTITRSSTVSIDQTTGEIILDDPIETATTLADLSSVMGGYFRLSGFDGVYYAAKDASITQSTTVTLACSTVTTYYTPTNGAWEYIHSADRDAYPDSSQRDGCEYEYLGIPFDNAAKAPKVETGSYTGTGTYGEDNPNVLAFDFAPKLLIVGRLLPSGEQSWYGGGFLWFPGFAPEIQTGSWDSEALTVNADGGQVSWYASDDEYGSAAKKQCNVLGVTYPYIAVGL